MGSWSGTGTDESQIVQGLEKYGGKMSTFQSNSSSFWRVMSATWVFGDIVKVAEGWFGLGACVESDRANDSAVRSSAAP